MPAYLDAFAALGLAVLFLAGLLLLGLVAIVYARALAETQRYRSHRLTTDGQQAALDASEDALDELEHHPSRRQRAPEGPSDEELLQWARAQGEDGPVMPPDEYTTTDRNAMQRGSSNGEAEIPADQLYQR